MSMVPEAYDCHDGDLCMFPEVEIGDDQLPESVLREGMKVLLPCISCGQTPKMHMDWQDSTAEELEKALNCALQTSHRVLYHWAPADRRAQIIRYGLRPSMRPTTNVSLDWRAPWVCLATDPNWSWALSGGQRGARRGEWDLWLTYADRLTEPYVVPRPEGNGIHEVRTKHRIYKRHLVFVGTREA